MRGRRNHSHRDLDRLNTFHLTEAVIGECHHVTDLQSLLRHILRTDPERAAGVTNQLLRLFLKHLRVVYRL